jgi:hypothetical protein
MKKRSCRRFTKRLEVTFSSGGSKYRGISSDLSADGLFIRTQNGLAPGNMIDIELYLPEDKVANIKGVVRRTVKTSLSLVKNGMGVEITERDSYFLDFLKHFDIADKTEDTAQPCKHAFQGQEEDRPPLKSEETFEAVPDFVIIACDNCKVKNKVRRDRLFLGPKCGKCGTVLKTGDIG